MAPAQDPGDIAYAHRRTACVVGVCFLALYSVLDVARGAGVGAYAARAVWVAAIALSALVQSPRHARWANAGSRLVGVVSGVCATVLVAAYGGSETIYFGFLLSVPFVVLVLVPDLPSSAALSGVVTTAGGIVLLLREGRSAVTVVEWTALAAVLNLLAGWGTMLYTRVRRAELAAHRARARAVSDLRISDQRFHAAFSSMSLGGIVVTLADTRVVAANAAVQGMLGYRDLVGMRYLDLLAAEDVADAQRLREELLQGHGSSRIERRFVTAAGQQLLASVHTAPVLDATGAPTTAIVLIEDITERRQLRERLSKSERLAALGTLAAGVAHEVNNPLAYVKANLVWAREVLHDGSFETEELARVLEETERGAERIARIVAELSAYARGREEPAPSDLGRILDDSLRMVSQRVGDACELDIQVAPGLPRVNAVGRHLSQALVNLLVNALDAVDARAARDPRAPRRVVVRASSDHPFVSVSVDDSGDGLPGDVAKHLFEPFFTTKGPLGTGLGLAISRENLSRFGATIEAGSSALGGARFVVRIPCAPANDAGRRSRSAA